MKRFMAIAVLAILGLTAAACGADATATPTATSAPIATNTPTQPHDDNDAAETGEALFRSKGCATCHGQNAEGGVGPALAGHTRQQVVNQVRNPVGAMPAFSTSALSDQELEYIVSFVLSLEGEGMHHDDEPDDMPMDDGMH